ncbi:hypothetical protein ES332_A10G221200v1 [Gossypium tomentosum]|uniref:Uncharacterized protein n=1 Tax=Gossypium tomentosum TaxID=34277 RepID=A0A5D2NUT7_GOSTO|nr:hypothetical protein ES332_A10G221200v1 [Gossypium tomentosum]
MEKNSDDTDGSRFRKENAPLSLLLLLLLFFGFVCRCTRSTKAKTGHFGAKRWQRHLGWLKIIDKDKVYEPILLELKYSSRWEKGKHAATNFEEEVLDKDIEDDELTLGSIATGLTIARPTSATQARLIERLN